MNRLTSILMLLLINIKYAYFSCTHFTCIKTLILFIYSNSISCLPTVSLLAEFFSTQVRVLVAHFFVALLLLLLFFFSRLFFCSFLFLYLFEIVWLTAIWNSSMLYGFAVDAFISSDWVLCMCLWSEASERGKNVNKTNNKKMLCFCVFEKTLARLNPLETWLQWIVAKTRLFVCYTRASKLIAQNSE